MLPLIVLIAHCSLLFGSWRLGVFAWVELVWIQVASLPVEWWADSY